MYKEGPFPFPLVSNEGLDVFRSYRCFDDFEQQPLHGTFLVDAQGLIRWQDIGHEPFMNVEFVLQEAQRLLHPEVSPPQGTVVAAAEE
jgi:alkyl hydroperoxide reductase subunit AhpC